MKELFENKTVSEYYTGLNNFKTFIANNRSKTPPASILSDVGLAIGREMGFFPFFCMPLDLTDNAFYRVRIIDDKTKADHVKEYGPIPAEYATAFQRANIPNYPVFYGSVSMDICAFELFYYNPSKIGSDFYLSKWKVGKPITSYVTPLLFKENVTSDLNTVAGTIPEKFEHQFSDLTEDQKKFMYDYWEFIATEFISEDSYVLSSFASHGCIYSDGEYHSDIVFYPTVKKKHNGINAAIHPDFVSKNLSLERVYHCRLEDTTLHNIRILPMEVGTPTGNSISWRPASDADIQIIREETNYTLR